MFPVELTLLELEGSHTIVLDRTRIKDLTFRIRSRLDSGRKSPDSMARKQAVAGRSVFLFIIPSFKVYALFFFGARSAPKIRNATIVLVFSIHFIFFVLDFSFIFKK